MVWGAMLCITRHLSTLECQVTYEVADLIMAAPASDKEKLVLPVATLTPFLASQPCKHVTLERLASTTTGPTACKWLYPRMERSQLPEATQPQPILQSLLRDEKSSKDRTMGQ